MLIGFHSQEPHVRRSQNLLINECLPMVFSTILRFRNLTGNFPFHFILHFVSVLFPKAARLAAYAISLEVPPVA